MQQTSVKLKLDTPEGHFVTYTSVGALLVCGSFETLTQNTRSELADKINIFSTTRFLTSFAFGTILPIYVLYFRHYQINLFQIGLLAAVFEASILIFEMPTGLLADIYGRRISIILSAVVSLISGLVFVSFPFLTGFIVAEILCGLGETFRSGALEAWLVDSLKHEGKEEQIKHAFAQGTKFKTAGNLFGLILGGYLASLNIKFVWVPFTIIFFILSSFLILKMREETSPPIPLSILRQAQDGERSRTVKWRGGTKGGEVSNIRQVSLKFSETIKQSLNVVRSQKLILALILFSLFSEFSFETISQFWQVHFNENLLIPTRYFGWILAIASVVTILFLDKVTKFSERFRYEASVLIILQTLFLFSLLFISLTSSPLLAVIFFILLQSFVSFKEPIFLDLYNKHIPSPQRATLLSFQSLVGSGGEVLAGLCIGVVAQRFGLRTTFGLGAVVLFVGISLFLFLIKTKPTKSGV
jgi:DHA3 family tetracycline resistance protein-like MFS transporter